MTRRLGPVERELRRVSRNWAKLYRRGEASLWGPFRFDSPPAIHRVVSDAQYSHRPCLTLAEAMSEALEAASALEL